MITIQTLEIPATLFGVINIYLAARANIWNWLFGILTVSLYLIIFFYTKLYADMGLQLVFLALQFYGWYQWLYGGERHTELQIHRLPSDYWKWLIIIGVVGGVGIFWLLKTYTDSTQITIDVTATTLSLIAQWQMSKKYLENWLVWIVVDIISIYLYIVKHLYFTAGLYCIFLLICIFGYRSWKILSR